MQLKVEHVCKHFALRGRAGALDVLDDINLEIAQGELIVLLGPSGCGKSTLLNIPGSCRRAQAASCTTGLPCRGRIAGVPSSFRITRYSRG